MFKVTNTSPEDQKTYYLGSVVEPENTVAPRKFFLGYDDDRVHLFKPDRDIPKEEYDGWLNLFIELAKLANLQGQVERA